MCSYLWMTLLCTAFLLLSQIERIQASDNCSVQTHYGFGFEVLMNQLEYLQHKLDELGHNLPHNISESILSKQATCNNPAKKTENKVESNNPQILATGSELRSCREEPGKVSGKFLLQINKEAYEGVCEQLLYGGGWLVIQHRFNGLLDFDRNWTEYRQGFGDIDQEFWIGLERLHRLTAARSHQLLVEVKTSAGEAGYAQYSEFEIGGESEKYGLRKLGTYNGTMGDSLVYHKGRQFSTKDQDNDAYPGSCAVEYGGAWWYNACHYSNLNGLYMKGTVNPKSMCWNSFKNQCQGLASSRMMIREV